MNRHIFALQQVARRTICSSARRQADNKVPRNQKMFQSLQDPQNFDEIQTAAGQQEDNGVPIHLKGGTGDALLYRATMVLTVLGTGYVVYEVVKAAFPQKK